MQQPHFAYALQHAILMYLQCYAEYQQLQEWQQAQAEPVMYISPYLPPYPFFMSPTPFVHNSLLI
jgi:hypothetical protein